MLTVPIGCADRSRRTDNVGGDVVAASASKVRAARKQDKDRTTAAAHPGGACPDPPGSRDGSRPVATSDARGAAGVDRAQGPRPVATAAMTGRCGTTTGGWTGMNEAGPATARAGAPLRSLVRRAVPLLVALGRGGETAHNRGALLPLGIAVCSVGYALGCFLEAAFDPDGRGRDTHRIAMRLGNATSGALHLGFAYSVARLLRTGDAGANSTAAAKGWATALLGPGVLGFAAYRCFQALAAKFRENAVLGRLGFAARGVVFAGLGLFLLAEARFRRVVVTRAMALLSRNRGVPRPPPGAAGRPTRPATRAGTTAATIVRLAPRGRAGSHTEDTPAPPARGHPGQGRAQHRCRCLGAAGRWIAACVMATTAPGGARATARPTNPRRPPMYARVVTGHLRPESLDRGLAVLEGEVRPHVSARAGFRGWELLVARASGRFHAITRWSSLVEAEAASRDGFGDRAGLLAGLLDGELDQAVFAVLA